MIPQIHCRKCGAELTPADRFCSACGTKVDWGAETRGGEATAAQPPAKASPAKPGKHAEVVCPLCGQINAGGQSNCESCGGVLLSQPDSQTPPSAVRTPSTPKAQDRGFSFFQTWKFTASIAIIAVLVVILLVNFRSKENTQAPSSHPANLSPQAQSVMNEIDALQKRVTESPNDTSALLRLANVFHDAKIFPRAIVMYDRYLALKPKDADARVDLGVSYFESSFSDSTRAQDDLLEAKRQMERALEYNPRHQLAAFNLGIINFHLGEVDVANQWLEKCAALDSTTEVGRKSKQFLTQHTFSNNRPTQ
jgi:predicted amidophosphoribosyltransferase